MICIKIVSASFCRMEDMGRPGELLTEMVISPFLSFYPELLAAFQMLKLPVGVTCCHLLNLLFDSLILRGMVECIPIFEA